MIFGIIISFTIGAIVSWFWVKGIDNMKKNHPDYKGHDFLNWDDDKNHTEGGF
jgi:hypothetical protein